MQSYSEEFGEDEQTDMDITDGYKNVEYTDVDAMDKDKVDDMDKEKVDNMKDDNADHLGG